MSLTSLLNKDPNVIKLFNCLPADQRFLKHYTPQPVYRNNRLIPIATRPKGACRLLVGTAYDFWLRAYIQRLNQFHQEKHLPAQVNFGLKRMEEEHFLSRQELTKFKELVQSVWQMRNDYIKGMEVSLRDLLKGCFYLAYCEKAMRSGERIEGNYFDVSYPNGNDLIRLAQATENIPTLFQTDKTIYLNPTFHKYSRLVGGADADFVIGETLIDIKTSMYPQFFQDYLKQLVGYYCLSQYDQTFPSPIRHIGIFYPRFNRFSFFTISYLEHYIDLELFMTYFLDILNGDSDSPVFRFSGEKLKSTLCYA